MHVEGLPHEHIEAYFSNPWPFMPSIEVRRELNATPYDPNFLQDFVASLQPEVQTAILSGNDNLAHEGDAVWRLIVASWMDRLSIPYTDQWFSHISETYKAKRGIQLAMADSTIGRLFRAHRKTMDRPVSNEGFVEGFEASLGAFFLKHANHGGITKEFFCRMHQQMAQLPRGWFIPFRGDVADHLVTHFGSRIETPRENDGRLIRTVRQLIAKDGTVIFESVGKDPNQAASKLRAFVQQSASDLRDQLNIQPSAILTSE